jgi:hypothetical protein
VAEQGENKADKTHVYEQGRRPGKRAPISRDNFFVPQTVGFRLIQSRSLLSQAKEWEHLALTELESYFTAKALDYD